MKLGLMKRFIATGLCAAMLMGDVLPVVASDSVSGGDVATVSGNDAVSVSGNSVSDNNAIVTLDSVTVDGVTITVSGPASAFAEGTSVSAVAVDPAEVVIAAAEENEQATVKKYKAFDINLVCNGEVVQPLNGQEIKVNFEGDMLIPDVENNEDVAVYHVDEEDNITKMEAEVAPLETEEVAVAETVEMTTTHFSTYVILVTNVLDERTITFEHWLDDNGELSQIFAPSEVTVSADYELNNEKLPVQGGTSFNMTKVEVLDNTGNVVQEFVNDPTDTSVITIELKEAQNTVRMYYTAASHTFDNAVTYYDYYIDEYVTETRLVDADFVVSNHDTDYNDRIMSFTYNGETYTNGNDGFMMRNNNGVYRGNSNNVNDRVLELEDWMVLTNVRLRGGNTYDALVFRDKRQEGVDQVGLFTQREEEVTVLYNFNAGINAAGAAAVANGDAFLSMGCTETEEITTEKGTNGNANDVSGYRDFWVEKDVTGTDAEGNPYTYEDLQLSINDNNTNGNKVAMGEYAIVPGIIEQLTDKNNDGFYETLDMGTTSDGKQIVEPGYFSNDQTEYKRIYNNYYLSFEQNGNTYDLNYSYRANGEEQENIMYSHDGNAGDGDGYNTQFLPINGETPYGGRDAFQFGQKDKNFYFGMRYDFTFELGSYIGPLEYEFYGDDDLWVFVDGELALDLGGLHSSYPGTYNPTFESNKVDLWQACFGIDTSKEEWWKSEEYKALAKDKEHTVTVLYMERGAYDSTCGMRFVVPNAKEIVPSVSKVPRTSVTLQKQDRETKEAIAEVTFTMYTDAACTDAMKIAKSDANGQFSFDNLRAGTYYIKETDYNQKEYLPNNTVYKVVVSVTGTGDDAKAVATVYEGVDGNAPVLANNIVYNTQIPKATLSFKKVQEGAKDNALKGAEFTLTGTGYSETATSDANGKFAFNDLKAGTYTLTETKTPDGFTNPGDESLTIKVEADAEYNYTVTVTDSDNIWLTFEDQGDVILLKNVKTVDVTINKEWENFKGEELAEEYQKEVVVELRRTAEGASSSELVEEIKLNADNSWNATREGLPYKNDEGKVYTYEVVEQTKLEGFTVEYGKDMNYDEYKYEYTITNIQKPGALKITKTVDKVDEVHGDASFTFKITCPDGSVLYRTMTFSAAATQEVVIDNLPAGSYTVEELDALRYELVDGYEKVQTKEVEAEKTTEYEFSNTKVFEKYYSHTDVAVNVVTFNRDADGNIESATISRETSSSDVYEVTADGERVTAE